MAGIVGDGFVDSVGFVVLGEYKEGEQEDEKESHG